MCPAAHCLIVLCRLRSWSAETSGLGARHLGAAGETTGAVVVVATFIRARGAVEGDEAGVDPAKKAIFVGAAVGCVGRVGWQVAGAGRSFTRPAGAPGGWKGGAHAEGRWAVEARRAVIRKCLATLAFAAAAFTRGPTVHAGLQAIFLAIVEATIFAEAHPRAVKGDLETIEAIAAARRRFTTFTGRPADRGGRIGRTNVGAPWICATTTQHHKQHN